MNGSCAYGNFPNFPVCLFLHLSTFTWVLHTLLTSSPTHPQIQNQLPGRQSRCRVDQTPKKAKQPQSVFTEEEFEQFQKEYFGRVVEEKKWSKGTHKDATATVGMAQLWMDRRHVFWVQSMLMHHGEIWDFVTCIFMLYEIFLPELLLHQLTFQNSSVDGKKKTSAFVVEPLIFWITPSHFLFTYWY